MAVKGPCNIQVVVDELRKPVGAGQHLVHGRGAALEIGTTGRALVWYSRDGGNAGLRGEEGPFSYKKSDVDILLRICFSQQTRQMRERTLC